MLIATIKECVKQLVPRNEASHAANTTTPSNVDGTSSTTPKSSTSMAPWLFMGAGVAAVAGGAYFGLETISLSSVTIPRGNCAG